MSSTDPRPTWPAALLRVAAPAALVALVLCLFQDAVFRGRVFFDRDLAVLWFEEVQSFVRVVLAGSWPVWDPYQGFGQPMLANPNRQILYPLTWLHLLVDPWTQHVVAVVVQSVLSALGVLALARRLGLSPWAALTSAGLWVASGPYVSLVNVWNHLSGAALLPWVLLLVDRVVIDRRLRDVLGLAAIAALQVVAGSPDMVAFSAALAAPLATWRAVRWPRPRSLRAGLSLLGALALAASLSAAQWVPTLAVLPGTVRASLAPATTQWSGTAPERLGETVVPLAPCNAGGRAGACTDRDRFLDSLYLGALGLPLAAAALATRRRAALGLGALVVAAGAWALGTELPLYEVSLHALPPLTLLRYPEKAFVVVALAWSLLGGLGLEAVTSDSRRVPGARASALVVTSLLLIGYGVRAFGVGSWWPELLVSTGVLLAAIPLFALARLPGNVARAGLAALAVLELAHLTQVVNPTAPRSFVAQPPLVARLAARDGATRVCVFPYDAALAQRYLGRPSARMYRGVPKGWTESMAGTHVAREMLHPPLGGAFGLPGSFDPDISGFSDRHQVRLRSVLVGAAGGEDFVRLLERTGVSHLVTLHEEGLEDLVPVARRATLLPEPILLLRVPTPLPRAYAVSTVRVVDDAEEATRLTSPGFDPRREALVASVPDPSSPAGREPPSSPAVVSIDEMRPDRVRLRATLDRSGWVVLLEAFGSGWTVTVDGAHAPIERANVAFRAVRVPEGTHALTFRYRPTPVLVGLAWSAAGLVVVLALALRRRT